MKFLIFEFLYFLCICIMMCLTNSLVHNKINKNTDDISTKNTIENEDNLEDEIWPSHIETSNSFFDE